MQIFSTAKYLVLWYPVLNNYYLGVFVPVCAGYCSGETETARTQKEIQGGSGLLKP